MKTKYYIIIFIIFVLSYSSSFCEDVNGELEVINGKNVLTIWGTHTERGYANGYLMGENILQVFNNYLLESVFMYNATYYEMARTYFETNFDVETKYYDEAQAIISGIEDSGLSIYNSILGRNVDEIDLLVSNSLLDIAIIYNEIDNIFSCSSLSSWGQSTLADPVLNGETIITRNLDWYPHQTLLDNQVLIVNKPSNSEEQDWISFSFAGMIGALSTINEGQVASFLNVGNNDAHPNPGPYHPIFLTIRNGIESSDYNNDGQCDPMDVAQSIEDKVLISDNIIHVISRNDRDTTAIVIECNNAKGVAIRTVSDNTIIQGDNLAATNHFRKLYSPVYCDRYENIADSLNSSTLITIDRSWELLAGAAGVITNIQTIQFIPFNGQIKWSTSPSFGNPAYQQIPAEFTTDDLFAVNSVENQPVKPKINLSAFPNPSQSTITIFYSNILQKNGYMIEVYNLRGKLIETKLINTYDVKGSIQLKSQNYPSGVYLYKLNVKNSPVKKFIIIK